MPRAGRRKRRGQVHPREDPRRHPSARPRDRLHRRTDAGVQLPRRRRPRRRRHGAPRAGVLSRSVRRRESLPGPLSAAIGAVLQSPRRPRARRGPAGPDRRAARCRAAHAPPGDGAGAARTDRRRDRYRRARPGFRRADQLALRDGIAATVRAHREPARPRRHVDLHFAPPAGDLPACRPHQRAARRPVGRHGRAGPGERGRARANDDRPTAGRVFPAALGRRARPPAAGGRKPLVAGPVQRRFAASPRRRDRRSGGSGRGGPQ